MQGQLARHGRLARALQADEHDNRRRLRPQVQPPRFAQRPHQFVVDDLDHLLARRQAAHHFLADSAFAHAANELLHHLEVDVSLQQRQAHLAHGDVDVALGQLAALLQVVEDGL